MLCHYMHFLSHSCYFPRPVLPKVHHQLCVHGHHGECAAGSWCITCDGGCGCARLACNDFLQPVVLQHNRLVSCTLRCNAVTHTQCVLSVLPYGLHALLCNSSIRTAGASVASAWVHWLPSLPTSCQRPPSPSCHFHLPLQHVPHTACMPSLICGTIICVALSVVLCDLAK